MAMEWRNQRNKGYVKNTTKGLAGWLNVEGIHFDVNATFWKDDKGKPFICVQRAIEKVFDEKTCTFNDIKPRPFIECNAFYTGKPFPNVSYKGYFYLASFRFELLASWETKEMKSLCMIVSRTTEQPLIKRINQIMKEKNHEVPKT